jgi:phosphorylcholine metabolism protein LicD
MILLSFGILYWFYSIGFLSNEMKDGFYDLFNKIHNILTENNIKYFIIAGTLLGTVREKEMIPWDDDIDIGIVEEDLEKFNKIDFKKYGLKAEGVNKNNIGKIFYIDKYDNGHKFKSIFVDVFLFQKKDDRYTYTDEFSKNTWPNEYFYEDELFPLKLYDFGKIKVYGPNKYEFYCKRAWGNSWTKPPFFRSNLYYIYCNNFYLFTVSLILFIITLLSLLSLLYH